MNLEEGQALPLSASLATLPGKPGTLMYEKANRQFNKRAVRAVIV